MIDNNTGNNIAFDAIKIGMASPEQIDVFRAYIEGKGLPFYSISAATRQGAVSYTQLDVYKRQMTTRIGGFYSICSRQCM